MPLPTKSDAQQHLAPVSTQTGFLNLSYPECLLHTVPVLTLRLSPQRPSCRRDRTLLRRGRYLCMCRPLHCASINGQLSRSNVLANSGTLYSLQQGKERRSLHLGFWRLGCDAKFCMILRTQQMLRFAFQLNDRRWTRSRGIMGWSFQEYLTWRPFEG